jgi:hypothetical protein
MGHERQPRTACLRSTDTARLRRWLQRGRRAGDSTDTSWTVSATGSVFPGRTLSHPLGVGPAGAGGRGGTRWPFGSRDSNRGSFEGRASSSGRPDDSSARRNSPRPKDFSWALSRLSALEVEVSTRSRSWRRHRIRRAGGLRLCPSSQATLGAEVATADTMAARRDPASYSQG